MGNPDIVLVTIDSLRADSVGFLDDSAPATPTMDAVAAESTIATAATAPSSHTRASVPAILTSKYAHNFFTNFLNDTEFSTVTERLADVGYETAAFHSNPLLSRHFGYDRGFDTFSDGLRFVENSRLPEPATRLYSKAIRLLRRFPYQPAEAITEQAVDWLSERGDAPVFLWVHYMDPHGPYALDRDRGYRDKFRSERLWRKAVTEPEAVTKSECRRLRDSYDAEVEHTDRHLSPLFEAVDAHTDNATVVLTGDHGEEFREHGTFSHHPKLYEEVTRVPFVLDTPRAVTPPEPISLLDVVPTLLAGVDGVAVPDSLAGIDLAADPSREHVIAETNPEDGEVMVGVRSATHKYIVHGADRELYDLTTDPGEQENLAGTGHEAESELRDATAAHLNSHDVGGGDKLASTAEGMDSEMQGRLEDLGYL
ncbi:sulfatase [Halobaculum sp. EA56]|uniref:sulfatase n=1 Tax=Halobaculum sp. EA56 TaxID=3421648 RepID=UPI003EBF8721